MRSGNGKSKPFCCDRVSECENRTCNLRQEPIAGNWLACGHVISRRLCGASVPTDHACRCGVHQPPQGNPACNCRRMVKEKFQSLLPHHPAGRFDARLGYSSARLLPSRAGIRFSEHSPVCHTSPPLRKATGQPESVASGQPDRLHPGPPAAVWLMLQFVSLDELREGGGRRSVILANVVNPPTCHPRELGDPVRPWCPRGECA